MKKVLMFILTLATASSASAQPKPTQQPPGVRVAMQPDAWDTDPDRAAFITHRAVPAVQGLDNGALMHLKELDFENGTIEFDIELPERGFVGIRFRQSDDHSVGEDFYIRSFWPVNPRNRTLTQYTTMVDSLSLWDLTDDYQAPAPLYQNQWNHVKLVANGRQLRVSVNDTAVLHVPVLESARTVGKLSLSGNAIFANLVVRPDATEDLPAVAGYDPTQYDPYYLRNWSVTSPVDFPAGRDVVDADLPDSTTQWKPIHAEHRALVNLSKAFGKTKEGGRRLAWLKTTIRSEKEQVKRLRLGFSDEVWVLINGQLLHVDKNYFGTPAMKEPRGRCTLANTSFDLPLRAGENELTIGVANYFYGWGLIARLDDAEGLAAK
ncbi:MAG: hypothetical protein WA958_11275 [Tunicatimonas sp.]